ncbi:MAG: hypothetical protein ABIU11_04405 [Chitinophagaceae bacterium]
MKYFFAFLFSIAVSSGIAYSQQTSSPKKSPGDIKKTSVNGGNQITTANPDSRQDLPVTYTFTGNGDWDNTGNWENNLAPPPTTNVGSEIIINNISGGECLLNIPYNVTPGTSLTILPGKTLRLSTNLIVN